MSGGVVLVIMLFTLAVTKSQFNKMMAGRSTAVSADSVVPAEKLPDEEEINLILSAEVERTFGKYQKDLVRDIADKKQLEVLVDSRLIPLVEEFLQNAEKRQERRRIFGQKGRLWAKGEKTIYFLRKIL
jgi:citrate lyase gamma subunit